MSTETLTRTERAENIVAAMVGGGEPVAAAIAWQRHLGITAGVPEYPHTLPRRIRPPYGMSYAEWRRYQWEVEWSEDVWADRDPWSEGSADWQDFTDGPAVVALAATPDRFREAVTANLPTKGKSRALGLVLLEVAKYANEDGAEVWPSNATVGKSVGISREAVNRNMRKAVDHGWLIPDG